MPFRNYVDDMPRKSLTKVLTAVLALSTSLLTPPAIASSCDAASFGSGSGDGSSSATPYIIQTSDHLRNIGLCDGVAKHFSVRTDIDLLGVPFTPIGSSGTFLSKISGEVFDGGITRSARISGLYVEEPIAGFILKAGSAAALKDLEFSGSIIATSASGDSQGTGLIAVAEPSDGASVTFESVKTSIDIRSEALRGVGGLVGWFRTANNAKAGELVFSSSSVIVSNSKGSIVAASSQEVGGLVGFAMNGKVEIQDSFTNVLLQSSKPGAVIGGLVGEARTASVDSLNSGSESIIEYLPLTSAVNTKVGGLVGAWTTTTGMAQSTSTIDRSYFAGLIVFRGDGAYGGLTGFVPASGSSFQLNVNDSYFSGTIARDPVVAVTGSYNSPGSYIYVGGLVGWAQDPITWQRVIGNTKLDLLGGEKNSPVFGYIDSGGVGVSYAGKTQNLSGVLFNFSPEAGVNNRTFGAAKAEGSTNTASTTGGVGISTALLATESTFTSRSFGNTNWYYENSLGEVCSAPYLAWQGDSGCQPNLTGVRMLGSGNQFEAYFSVPVNGSGTFPSPSVFSVLQNGVSQALSGQIAPGPSSRSLIVSLPTNVGTGDKLEVIYTDPNLAVNNSPSEALEAELGGQVDVRSRSLLLLPTLGPTAALSSSLQTPTTIEIGLTCGGSCGSADSYGFVASITPAGGSPATISGTANSTVTTLSFTALTPSVSHTIQASVTNNGQTSATVSTTVVTPRPSASISALTVTDTSATLIVGCTNCGAAPDSFTVSATPVAGGPAITSNTTVISGLTSETTYSFAVVVRFAGVDSDSANWQSNPVMTLPFVPVISSVSPAAVPLTGGSITVTGSNFTTSSLLTLGGTSLAFTIVSGTEITFSAPSGTAGSVDLAITNPVGTFTLSNAITYVSGPSLATNSPVLATTNGGTIVTLTGTDLATTNQVNVGSTTVSFSVVSDTAVRFTTAATTAGIVDIGVVTVGGTDTLSSAIEFTASALAPVIGAIAPTSGTTAGGTTITVTGQYFSGSYSDSVSAAINGVSGSSIVLIDDSTLTFVSPPGAAATGLDVTVATGGGLGTLAGAFSYTAPPAPSSTPGSAPPVVINTPTITEFSTREISASGAEVIATGLRLENVSVLTLGGITVTIVSNTSTSITFTTGEMPVGVWDLRLVGSNGTLVFQQAIEVVEATAIVAESTGELLGWTWTLKFLGNSRSLHDAQAAHLTRRLNPNAETIICWGYTTAENPNAWAIAHATQRAQAACDLAIANNSEVKTVVRLRYGVSKSWAMRSALQFWR